MNALKTSQAGKELYLDWLTLKMKAAQKLFEKSRTCCPMAQHYKQEDLNHFNILFQTCVLLSLALQG